MCVLAGAVATCAAAACADAEDGNTGLESVVRDSAGVTIVENEQPAADTRLGWRVGAEPTLSIGALEADPEYELYQVMDAAGLPDGRIVVANAGSGELRVFDASGTHLASWGGRGEGPGEFGDLEPSEVDLWPGDSIAALETGRISIFDANGVHGRTSVLERPYRSLIGILPGGQMFVSTVATFMDRSAETGVTHPEVEYAIMSAEGSVRTVLGAHRVGEWYVKVEDGSFTVRVRPFGRSAIARPWGERVAIGFSDRYEIRVFDTEGAVTRIVRRDHRLRGPTGADIEEYAAEQYTDYTEERRAEAVAALNEIPLVESFPAFRRVVTDALGYLWVEDYQLPGEAAPAWTVFDAEGRVQGLVEIPPDLTIFEIGEDYILGRVSDDLGIERVQLWSLDRSGS